MIAGLRARLPRLARLRRLRRLLQPAAVVALLIFLIFELSAIGWMELSPPTSPLFYAAVLALYFVQPLVDTAIYRGLWPISFRALPVFLRKRVFNEVLFDYSGEIVLYAWAKRNVRPRMQLFAGIRDTNLLSGAVSNGATLILVACAAAVGLDLLPPEQVKWALFSIAVTAGITVSVLAFGPRFFSLSPAAVLRISLLHLLRLGAVLTLYAAAWTAALPSVPLLDWLPILAAKMLLTRLPFLPNRELMIAWLGISLAPIIAADTAESTAMFVTVAAMMLALHAVVYVATSLSAVKRQSIAVGAVLGGSH